MSAADAQLMSTALFFIRSSASQSIMPRVSSVTGHSGSTMSDTASRWLRPT